MTRNNESTKVFLQVHPTPNTPHSLSSQAAIPASRLNLLVNSVNNTVTPSLSGEINTENSSSEIPFAKVFLSELNSPKFTPTLPLNLLLKGQSIGLMIGGALESFSLSSLPLSASQTTTNTTISRPQNIKNLQEIINELQILIDYYLFTSSTTSPDSNATISLSYNIYGISDTSCVDLVNYSRVSMEELENLHPRNHERAMDLQYPLGSTLDSLIDLLNQGSSLPLLCVIRVITRPSDLEPANISHLLLADFGSIFCPNHPLVDSITSLRSGLLDVKEGIKNSIPKDQSFLASVLRPYFGMDSLCFEHGGDGGGGDGDNDDISSNPSSVGAHSFFWANLPSIGSSRALTKSLEFLQIISSLAIKVSSCKESAELLELEALLLVHAELEGDYQHLKEDIKAIQKDLEFSNERRNQMERLSLTLKSENILVKLQLEFEIAGEEMKRIELMDLMRRKEIDSIYLECEKNLALSNLYMKEERIAYLEGYNSSSQRRENLLKEEALKEIGHFVSALQESNLRLTTLDSERQGLTRNLDHCQAVIRDLEKRGSDNAESFISNGESVRLKNEIIDLKRQLSRLKTQEDSSYDLERQIENLKFENIRLKREGSFMGDGHVGGSGGANSSSLSKVPRTSMASTSPKSTKPPSIKSVKASKKVESYDPLMAFSLNSIESTPVISNDDDIEVPGTPPKKTLTDKWRPSAFVPKSLSQTLTSGISGLSGMSGSLSNDHHNHASRIKLPTRNDQSTTLAASSSFLPTPQPRERKSVDPKAFQGIMSSFQMPSK